jgi:outer membrane protein insertion porin family
MKLLRSIVFILLAGVPAAAQQNYTAMRVVFNHPGLYTQAQLEGVAGIHPTTSFTVEGLGAAAQRLADSGFFADVSATFSGNVTAVTVLFDVKPLDPAQLLRLRFENFVWLTHDEVLAALRTRAPLFLDSMPEASPLLDSFNDALVEALAKKGITAKVAHDTFEPTLQRPERDIDFWVMKPAVRVANVKLAGVSTGLAPLIQKAVNGVAGKNYSSGMAGARTEDRILAPLLDAGYIDASLSDESIEQALSGDTASVVLSGTLHSGEVYRVSSIAFAGAPLLSADLFAAGAKLHSGDIASRAQLIETLRPLDASYRRQGYMDVIVHAEPKADAPTHQVAYDVTVTPGEQYRIHAVTANGLDPAAQADFDRGFTMKAGELYSPGYVEGFLKNNTAHQALRGYSAAYKAYADPLAHTVDLVLTFVRGGAH